MTAVRLRQNVIPQESSVDAVDAGLDGVTTAQFLAKTLHRVTDVEVEGDGELPGHLVFAAQDEEVARVLTVGDLLAVQVAHLYHCIKSAGLETVCNEHEMSA